MSSGGYFDRQPGSSAYGRDLMYFEGFMVFLGESIDLEEGLEKARVYEPELSNKISSGNIQYLVDEGHFVKKEEGARTFYQLSEDAIQDIREADLDQLARGFLT